MKKIIFLLITNILLISAFSQTSYFGGTISSDTIWNSDTIKIIGDVIIDDSVTLTIEPGLYIEFQNNYSINVGGRIISNGNMNDTIIYTVKDTLGFYNDSIPNGGWGGIKFNQTPSNNDTSKLSFCKLQYIKSGCVLNLYYFSKIVIENNLFLSYIRLLYYSPACVILCYESSPIIKNNKIAECWGNAVQMYSNSSPIISNNNFSNAGICCFESSPLIYNNTIIGGNIQCRDNSNAHISNNQVSDNNDKAGIVVEDSNPIISDNIISNNINWHPIAGYRTGGGITCGNSSAIIYKNIIFNNIASGGGGIFCSNSSPLILLNMISNNYSCQTGCGVTDGGGGIFTYTSSPKIINNIICNNSSIGQGGGIYCNGTACNPLIVNNTIVNNSAFAEGGFYSRSGSNPIIINSIIWGNEASDKGDQIYIEDYSSHPQISFCDIDTIEGGMGYTFDTINSIKINPEFILPTDSAGINFDGLDADWNLQPYSPCINAGTPDTTGLFLYSTDFAGNNRIINDTIDIGAYEYNVNSLIQNYYESDRIVLIYPNPANNFIHIYASEKSEIKILNIEGQLLKTIIIDGSHATIDISNLSRGMYFIIIKTKDGISAQKFIKE